MTGDHYFSIEPASPDKRFPLRVRLAGLDLDVESSPGVFSGDRLDPGTSVLLDHAPPPPAGNLLDLGCGWGPIALTMGLLTPEARIWAVDTNRRALDLAWRNVDSVRLRHDLASITVCPPDGVPPELRFDALWSNPPIRIGKEPLHRLLSAWIPRLAPGAEAYLVVQKNLGADSLARWMSEQTVDGAPWGTVERVASSRGFRVLKIGRPSPGS